MMSVDIIKDRAELYAMVAWLRLAPRSVVPPEFASPIRDLLMCPPTLILERLEKMHEASTIDDGVTWLWCQTIRQVIANTKHFIATNPEEIRLQKLVEEDDT